MQYKVSRRYGNEIRELFGIEPKALTATEAGYLIGFKGADTLRNRAAKAKQERISRVRSKEIRTPKTDISLQIDSEQTRPDVFLNNKTFMQHVKEVWGRLWPGNYQKMRETGDMKLLSIM